MTIRQIASKTGLSTTTVCKALSNPLAVRPETWRKIEEAQAEAPYSRLNRIQIVLPDLKNNFFAELLSGAIDKLSSEGLSPQVYLSYDNAQKEKDIFDSFSNRSSEGIIWVPAAYGGAQNLPSELRSRIVLADRCFEDERILLRVSLDNQNLAFQAVSHLKKVGIHDLCFLNGPQDSYTAGERALGALSADDSITIYSTDFSDEKIAYDVANKALDAGKFKGYLLGNQTIAFGFFRAIKERNISCPPCIMFDYPPYITVFPSTISYISLPAYQIGFTAATMLTTANPRTLKKQSSIIQGSLHWSFL
ncbi:MAG: LacI family DNA-binding transcriptional regulator [Brevinema sp.]